MKLKSIGLKFVLGTVLLSFLVYILLTFSSVFSSHKYDLTSFQYSQFLSDNSSFVIYEEEGTFFLDDEVVSGEVSLIDGVIYLAAEDNYSFVIINADSLFYSPKFQYFDRIGG